MKKDWIRSVLWLLMIGLFVGILIWFLSTLNVRLFRKSASPISTLNEELIQEDIFSISYPAEIKKAISGNNYRQAIRLYYLQSLTLLSQKNWIDYKQESTNSEYVNQLIKTPLFNDFFRLTKNFEYTWYGRFDITQPVFSILQKDFETFNKQLQS